ncbi:MAG: 2-hydroxyacyl-CoA dehydratase [Thermoleophilia bacterium]|nr:2-hydroxyacyl-CoA dehydratase [Thermoleophilia bacterium]
MNALAKLDEHLGHRLTELRRAKERGRKIIGYAAGGYFPEELALACDALPVGFVRGGDKQILNEAGAYTCRFFDPFWRSQIGYVTSKRDPYYTIADLIVIPITDNHCRVFANTVGYYTPEIPSVVFGVPHVKDKYALEYYLQGIRRLKSALEEFTGVEITEERLKKAIQLCNRERRLLREISETRKAQDLRVSSKDFVALNHGSFLADKESMVQILESFVHELADAAPLSKDGPRIVFTGSTLAQGDTGVMDIIEDRGGVIVVEEFAEGLRPYWGEVKIEGDLLANLAEAYFMERVCPGWFRPATERLDFLIQLAKDYRAEGVVWYQLLYRESYKVDSYFFPERLKKEAGLPMLVLESEYDAMDKGPLTTRIETFIETVRR